MTLSSSGAVSAHLIVKSELSELGRVSDWINEWAGQHGLSNHLAQRLDLCSTEAVTNIISYAYDDNAEHPIALRLCRRNDLINLEVEDDGKPFNPLQVQECAPISGLENARIGGCGIPIVRRFSDAADYRYAGGKNCLTLRFRCGATAPP